MAIEEIRILVQKGYDVEVIKSSTVVRPDRKQGKLFPKLDIAEQITLVVGGKDGTLCRYMGR
jgi:hypothetical protein